MSMLKKKKPKINIVTLKNVLEERKNNGPDVSLDWDLIKRGKVRLTL
uniref:Uncharacterized protein n=1 Tax=Lepeophtheirus salmonis TaxID=72036 RepID=A0A0K2T184_LEPSM